MEGHAPIPSPHRLPGIKILQYRSPQGRRFPAHSSPPGAGTEAIIGVTGCPRSTASGRSSGTGARTPSRSRGRTEGAHQLAGPLCATRFPDTLRGIPTARLQPGARRKVRKPGWAQQTWGPSPQARGKAEFRPGARGPGPGPLRPERTARSGEGRCEGEAASGPVERHPPPSPSPHPLEHLTPVCLLRAQRSGRERGWAAGRAFHGRPWPVSPTGPPGLFSDP